jgi:uncharacterized membrane protein
MSYYSGSSQPPSDQEPRGCREVLALTRAAFGVLLVPLGIIFGVIVALVLIFYLFSRSWILGLIGLAVVALGIYLYARWERRHFPGP